jgi:hypothetical protein
LMAWLAGATAAAMRVQAVITQPRDTSIPARSARISTIRATGMWCCADRYPASIVTVAPYTAGADTPTGAAARVRAPQPAQASTCSRCADTVRTCTYYRCSPDPRNHAHQPWYDSHPAHVVVREDELTAPLQRFFAQRVFGDGRELLLARAISEPATDDRAAARVTAGAPAGAGDCVPGPTGA